MKNKKVLPKGGLKKIKKAPALAQIQPEEIKLKRTKIRVVGIGEGGSSIVSEIASRVKKATFFAANTNKQALKISGRNVSKFYFGENFTGGLGTGMKPEIGEQAALAEAQKIKKIFEGQDLCLIVACLGGGVGSGAAPIFAKIAKSTGCLTYGIFTLPFNFEGEKKAVIAKESLKQLKSRLHAFSIIPNERIFNIISKETSLNKALSCINERLAQNLEGLIETIYEPGLINIDFADLRAVLEGQGKLAYLNCVKFPKKEGVIQEEIEELLNSPLYPYGIKGAKGVLYNIAGGKALALSEVSQVSKTISELVNKTAKIIFGISQNSKYEGKIKTTLLATGCASKIFAEEKPVKPKANLANEPSKEKEENQEQEVSRLKPKASKKVKKEVLPKKKAKPKKKLNKKMKIKTVKKNKNEKKKSKPALPQSKKKNKKQIAKKPQNLKKPGAMAKKPKQKKKIKKAAPLPKEQPDIAAENQKVEIKIRKNALQVKKEAEEMEADMLAREKAWETPAFLRRRKIL